MTIIKTENLTKIYSDGKVEVVALRDVNLEIMQGEFVVVAGPSGSGKTTLLNQIGGLDKPTEGRVYLEGKDITQMKKDELAELRLRKIGFIFQTYNLIPVLTVSENVELPLVLLGIPERQRKEQVMEVLNLLDISELANKKPNEISGGQQQRVAIARAIITRPSIILADEPTAHLDSKTGGMLIDVMIKMNREKGITFIICSHDPQVIQKAGRLIRLRDGMIEDDKKIW
ncbi:putative ABC transport system ATP-binding protein [Candidatus Kryptonium thompsonii]|jgi:putative ABC transport system ATP-binding protein|uniref:ABC transport system ATP-binding protein n=1 Tax=Candidatus Kryptonium thompsonii TaxID=1633631 RepID=A0A0P1LY12_9BACT|nr:ABC transporter ATP-binding protein [Candidatus Kryptonium thompsoni]CUS77934.1 putative ABC transport system ATP-binding protein [Candidatus Kryptonium thompsoni]CUS79395.1 putative ABC transport system ATP-binding protein [Candidatus Kryptonium thompsoni]CUS81012.1 putative ABC transport system ATP-binding protein [Candidatus Kryptonium thompsoni]CUS86036.1 putative ABC transport system ATP-binding protein [Candidatus Kryptonium thompsoni]CUS93465.1 putative ABC transport system ATP-bindi